jgi:uncharacterized protein (TIGR02757 family)
LEELYRQLNRREYVEPDPLQFLYAYPDPADREIVGLVAATLAYGRVAMILRSVAAVLDRLGPTPVRFLHDVSAASMSRALAGFKHRFTTGDEMAALLMGVRDVGRRHGSLEACFAAGQHQADPTVLPALGRFAGELAAASGRAGRSSLLSDPAGGSACKRLNLYLRWMVRLDAVDPGGWRRVPQARLVVPLDTHMFRLGRTLGATRRNQADGRTALEITAAFARISPEDPVRYDFSLTRLGIRKDVASPFLQASAE